MRLCLTIAVLATAPACQRAPAPPGPGQLAILDTLTRPADGRLGAPTGVGVGDSGWIYVVDAENAQVAVLDTLGAVRHRFGGRGTGPGEMTRPRSLTVSSESLWVTDAGNDQVQVYTTAGTFVRSLRGLPWLGMAEIAFNSHGAGLLAQHGRDTALALHIRPDGAIGPKLGTPLALPDYAFDFRQGKAQLAGGTIPPALMSYSGPAIAEDGSTWVLRTVAGEIERYDAADSLRWTTALPDTLRDRLRRGLFARTRQDTTDFGFTFPNVLVAAQPIGDTLWVLVQGAVGATALGRLAPSGDWLPWLYVPQAGTITAFAVAPAQRTLYLLDRSEGTIVRVALPRRPPTTPN
jgi:hypothetical protein